jgi:CheY-like chemotaxis protein
VSEKTQFLLVEDDLADAEFVSMAFKNSGHQLHVVNDGQHAIDYLSGKVEYADRRKFPLPQVILLDLKMPRVNGFEFLKWLRHQSPGDLRLLPVIIMSSSDEPSDVKTAYALGVNSYLVKPIRWQEFQERMKALNVFWGSHTAVPPVTAA